ncbi:MAG: glycosyltransferase family 39 protein [Elusimicrobia bacterium]|nr:glycosyltransferase family 39 protein [Candidatus Obscuribacterium magneticum]
MSTANAFIKTGEIRFTLHRGVVNPKFEDISSAGQDGIRGIYYGILGVYERLFGKSFFAGRFLSWLCWVLTGMLLFRFIKRNIDIPAAWLATAIWFSSLETTLIAHLVRPDIFLCLALLSILILYQSRHGSHKRTSAILIGSLSVFAVGIHPHGLAFIPLVFLLPLLTKKSDGPNKSDFYIWLSLGCFAGFLILLLLSDIPTEIMSMKTLEVSLFLEQAHRSWVARLFPLSALADAISLLLNPSSFYFSSQTTSTPLWQLSGLCRFFSFLLTIAWIFSVRRSQPHHRILLGLAVYFFFAIGFGHLRREFIYCNPLTLIIFPLMAIVMTDCLDNVKNRFRQLPNRQERKTFLISSTLLCTATLGFLWCFRYSVLFYLLLGLLLFHQDGHKNRHFFALSGLFLMILLSLYIRDKSLITSLNKQFVQAFHATYGLTLALGSSLCLALSIFISRKKDALVTLKKSAGPFIKLTFLSGVIVFNAFINIRFQTEALTKNTTLNDTFNQTNVLVKDKPTRVLGPAFYWFLYFDSFRSIDALMDDYYYTGQKNPKANIDRFKPEILIIDEEFIRKFLFSQEKGTKKFIFKPLTAILSPPFEYLGEIRANLHHSNLYLYRLFWDKLYSTSSTHE